MKRIKAEMVIPTDILDIQKIFTANDKKLFVVGGAVRDFILGKVPHDFDLVTDAIPTEVISILNGYNTDLQGDHFGVVRVFTEDEPMGHEIASFRVDIAKGRDNKRGTKKVETGKHITIEDDVKRRDLTINSLFFDIETSEIVDITGGIDDIRKNIIRTVGEPQTRFNEDRLRIIRSLRFSATLNARLDTKLIASLKNDSKIVNFDLTDYSKEVTYSDFVSKERIIAEFIKVEEKSENNPQVMKRFFDLLIEFNIFQQIFPTLDINIDTKPTDTLVLMLAQILSNNKLDNNFFDVLVDAKLSNHMIDNIDVLISLKQKGITPENVFDFHKIIKSKNISIDLLKDWVDLIEFDTHIFNKFITFVPKTSGLDVMKEGFKGKEIGEEIKRRESIRFSELIKK